MDKKKAWIIGGSALAIVQVICIIFLFSKDPGAPSKFLKGLHKGMQSDTVQEKDDVYELPLFPVIEGNKGTGNSVIDDTEESGIGLDGTVSDGKGANGSESVRCEAPVSTIMENSEQQAISNGEQAVSGEKTEPPIIDNSIEDPVTNTSSTNVLQNGNLEDKEMPLIKFR